MPGPTAAAAAAPPRRFQRFGPMKALAGTVAAAGVLIPAELVMRRFRPRGRARLPWLFHNALARSLGIRVKVHGRRARRGGVLFVANHISWADIPVLGSLVQAAFVAKADVGQIALVGWLADLSRTVYVDRDRRQASGDQRNAIQARLGARENVILFPEATTGDGVAVLPFKSALFAAVGDDPALVIQPVTIAYTRLNGLPITRENLPDIAWIGDTELWPHAVAFTAMGRVRCDVVFHPPVAAADFADRKALSRHCRAVIAAAYRGLMRGEVPGGAADVSHGDAPPGRDDAPVAARRNLG